MENENVIKSVNERQEYSNIVPIWKFVLLSILSFNFYYVYWTYKNWIDIKNNFAEYRNINPLLRTLGTFLFHFLGFIFFINNLILFNKKAKVYIQN